MTVSVLLDFYCMKKKPAAMQPASASPFRPGDTLYNNRGKLAGQISSLTGAFPVRRSICPVDDCIILHWIDMLHFCRNIPQRQRMYSRHDKRPPGFPQRSLSVSIKIMESAGPMDGSRPFHCLQLYYDIFAKKKYFCRNK